MPKRGTWGRKLLIAGLTIASSCVKTTVQADDVLTLSGQTYRQVRLVRLEPDGVVWAHATGMCKVDFTDLPEPIRARYHYDAKRAATYQAAQTQARQRAADQAQQDQRKLDAFRAKRVRQRQGELAAGAREESGTFVFHRERTLQKVEESVGEQVTARQAEFDKLTEYDGTIYDRHLWKIPQMLVGVTSDGHAFDPPDTGSPEYRRSLFRPPADKAYYQDVDRAEAFAKGKP